MRNREAVWKHRRLGQKAGKSLLFSAEGFRLNSPFRSSSKGAPSHGGSLPRKGGSDPALWPLPAGRSAEALPGITEPNCRRERGPAARATGEIPVKGVEWASCSSILHSGKSFGSCKWADL